MDQSKPIMLRVLSTAVGVIKTAGDEIRRIAKTGVLGVVDKGIQDLQTEADRTAQRLIVASLTERFPKCKIVGEEELREDSLADKRLLVSDFDQSVLENELPKEFHNVREDEITIWVDPLDGTSEFVRGLWAHVTVLIGISVGGKAVAGVIHQPFYEKKSASDEYTGRTIWALQGLGCYGLTPKQLASDKLIITSTASHRNKISQDSIDAIKPDEIIRVGGAGHKVVLVIEGSAHAYVFTSNGCKKWDTCAPEAVLKASGGCLTDTLGNELDYNVNETNDYQNYMGIIASCNRSIHDRILEKIPKEIGEVLKAQRELGRSKC